MTVGSLAISATGRPPIVAMPGDDAVGAEALLLPVGEQRPPRRSEPASTRRSTRSRTGSLLLLGGLLAVALGAALEGGLEGRADLGHRGARVRSDLAGASALRLRLLVGSPGSCSARARPRRLVGSSSSARTARPRATVLGVGLVLARGGVELLGHGRRGRRPRPGGARSRPPSACRSAPRCRRAPRRACGRGRRSRPRCPRGGGCPPRRSGGPAPGRRRSSSRRPRRASARRRRRRRLGASCGSASA